MMSCSFIEMTIWLSAIKQDGNDCFREINDSDLDVWHHWMRRPRDISSCVRGNKRSQSHVNTKSQSFLIYFRLFSHVKNSQTTTRCFVVTGARGHRKYRERHRKCTWMNSCLHKHKWRYESQWYNWVDVREPFSVGVGCSSCIDWEHWAQVPSVSSVGWPHPPVTFKRGAKRTQPNKSLSCSRRHAKLKWNLNHIQETTQKYRLCR